LIAPNIAVALQVDGYTMTKALVTAGLGYTILPLNSFQREMASGEVSAARVGKPDISWTLSMAYRRDQRTARAVEALRDIIRAEVGKLVAAGTWRGEEPVRGRRQAVE
jgi:LysR family nitrogen assimilation transcriptional regulator